MMDIEDEFEELIFIAAVTQLILKKITDRVFISPTLRKLRVNNDKGGCK